MRILLLILGGLCVTDTLLVLTVSHPNLGVVLPAILGLPLLLAGIFYPALQLWWQQGVGKVIRIALIALYGTGLCAVAVTCACIASGIRPDVDREAKVYFVLGAGVHGDTPTLSLRYRLDRAMDCYRENPDALFVVSGGVDAGETRSEAAVMGAYLQARGMPPENILLEEAAASTRENFLFSRQLLLDTGRGELLSHAAFITTDFHVYRATRVAQKAGMALTGVAARGVWFLVPNDWLRECAALWVYALTGRI